MGSLEGVQGVIVGLGGWPGKHTPKLAEEDSRI